MLCGLLRGLARAGTRLAAIGLLLRLFSPRLIRP